MEFFVGPRDQDKHGGLQDGRVQNHASRICVFMYFISEFWKGFHLPRFILEK